MSSAGYAQGFFTPEEVATEQGLRRRQAYAQALLQGDTPQGAYGGLASAGNKLLGAFLSNKTDAKEADLAKSSQSRYATDMAAFLKGGNGAPAGGQMAPQSPSVPSPQISNAGGPDMPVEGAGPTPQPIPNAQGPAPMPQAIPNAQGAAPAPTPMGLGGPPQPSQPQSPMERLLATGNPALIQQFAPGLLQHQLGREDKVWENSQPLSVADQQKSQLDLDRSEALEKFKNGLPLNEKDRASLAIQRGQLGVQQGQLTESRRHNQADENLKAHPFGIGIGNGVDGQPVTGKPFLEQLAKQNPGVAGQVKAIAEYRQPAPASRSTQSMALMNAVSQYKPDYDSTQFAGKNKARLDFTTGKNGNTVRSLNVAVQHLDQLGQLSDAMGNGDIQMVNKLGNLFATQTGSPAPTNFNAAKQLVGDEIVKAIVGAGGGVSDREEAAHNISAASSPQQLAGVIKTYQGLLSGQLVGLRQQYSKSTGLNDFEDFLAPETRAKLENHGTTSGASNGHPPPPPGFVVH